MGADPRLRDGPRAVATAQEAVAIGGRKNPNFLAVLAAAHAEAGQFTNAVSVQKEALALLQSDDAKKKGTACLRLYEAGTAYHDEVKLAGRAYTLLSEGKFAEAEPSARECLTLQELLDPDGWRTCHARSLFGGSLLGQKKYAEAEPLLVSGYEGMVKRVDKIPTVGILHPTEGLQRLVKLYEETGRPDQAAAWKQKLAEFEKLEAEKKPAQ
jgi:hypothetical protein